MQHYRERRFLVNHDVRVSRGTEAWRGTIMNATREGMRLRTAAPLMLEDGVSVEGGSWSVEATVIWMKNGTIGLKLVSPIGSDNLARLTGKSMRLNRKSRVGFGI